MVTELLKGAQGKVNISFDLWSSKNLLSLCSLVVHFIADGKLHQFLLSIPWLVGAHTGLNIAESVAAILAEFDLQDQVGYFTLDNAKNNNTCKKTLAQYEKHDSGRGSADWPAYLRMLDRLDPSYRT